MFFTKSSMDRTHTCNQAVMCATCSESYTKEDIVSRERNLDVPLTDLVNQLPMVSSVMHQCHGNQPLPFLLPGSYHQLQSVLSDVLDLLLHSRPLSRDTLRKASVLCLHLCFISKNDLASFNRLSCNTFHTITDSSYTNVP